MKIYLYKNSAAREKVDKTSSLSLCMEISGTLRDNCSITSPTILFEASPAAVPNAIVSIKVSSDVVDSLSHDIQARVNPENVQAREWIRTAVADADNANVADSEVYIFRAGSSLNDIVDSSSADIVRLVDGDIAVLLNESIHKCNYAYIPDFNRYYFIRGIDSVRKDLWRIQFSVDTLMSFKERIYAQKLFCERTAAKENGERGIDEMIPLLAQSKVSFEKKENENSLFGGKDFESNQSHEHCIIVTYISQNMSVSLPYDVGGWGGMTAQPNAQNIPSSWQYKMLALDLDNFITLLNYVFNNEDKATYIVSAMLYPFDLNKGETEESLVLFDADSGAKGIAVDQVTAHYKPLTSFSVSKHFTDCRISFLNYSPYSSYQLFLPYKGWIDLPADEILGQTLAVWYIFNPQNGNATVNVSKLSEFPRPIHLITLDDLIYSGTCQLGVKLPITTSNAKEISDSLTQSTIQMVLSELASAASLAGGAALVASGGGSPIGMGMMASGIGGGVKAAADYGGKVNSSHVRAQATLGSGELGMYSAQAAWLKTEFPLIAIGEGFFDEYGRVERAIISLSELRGTGYAIFSNVHLEGLNEAYSPEIAEIARELESGVIL